MSMKTAIKKQTSKAKSKVINDDSNYKKSQTKSKVTSDESSYEKQAKQNPK